MSSQATLPTVRNKSGPRANRPLSRNRDSTPAPLPFRSPAHFAAEDAAQRQAELFYLQKQIQSRTAMIVILEDGEQLEGCIEWYDRNALKIRGRQRTMVYKSAIKYMYKVGDRG